VLAATLLVAGAGGLALILLPRGAPPAPRAGSHAGTGPGHPTEAEVRAQAETWIRQQVSRSAIVSCDSQVCTDLQQKGFPSANLWTLGPQATDPLNSDLVVATADIRAQFGPRLASAYAPVIIASFGSGNTRIDIRWVYPGGTAQYQRVQGPTLHRRKATDAQLLANDRLTVSATARAQLVSGNVDPRLPWLLAAMAHYHPLHIVDFVNQSPGAGPGSLLRSVDLATADGSAHLARAAYLGWMRKFIDVQRAPFHPAWAQQVTLPAGPSVLRIGFGAPSMLSPPASGASG